MPRPPQNYRGAAAVATAALRSICAVYDHEKRQGALFDHGQPSDVRLMADKALALMAEKIPIAWSENMRPAEVMAVATQIRKKHIHLQGEALKMLEACEQRARDGLNITEGQTKWMRSARSAKYVEDSVRPSNWRGRWLVA